MEVSKRTCRSQIRFWRGLLDQKHPAPTLPGWNSDRILAISAAKRCGFGGKNGTKEVGAPDPDSSLVPKMDALFLRGLDKRIFWPWTSTVDPKCSLPSFGCDARGEDEHQQENSSRSSDYFHWPLISLAVVACQNSRNGEGEGRAVFTTKVFMFILFIFCIYLFIFVLMYFISFIFRALSRPSIRAGILRSS